MAVYLIKTAGDDADVPSGPMTYYVEAPSSALACAALAAEHGPGGGPFQVMEQLRPADAGAVRNDGVWIRRLIGR